MVEEKLNDFLISRLSITSISKDLPDNVKPAGVLIVLFWENGSLHVLLTLRSSFVGDHKNEVSFPGGRLEDTDFDMQECALRETHEEIGIQPKDVYVLGNLDVVVTRTGYAVWPTVGTITYPYEFYVSKREVEEIIKIPISELLNPLNFRYEAVLTASNELKETVSFAYGQNLIFGATAKIIHQLLQIFDEAQRENISLIAKGDIA